MKDIDFIPKNGKLCKNCIWYDICPLEYHCETFERNYIYEMYDDVRNGDSTEKVH